MGNMDSQTEALWRERFKTFNRFMVLMWRLGLGNWVNSMPMVGGRIMVLVHRGRKTGARRYTPVNYATIDGDIYCTAGFGAVADWYKNILADPDVEVWLPDGWYAGSAAVITEDTRRLPYLREVLLNSGFAAPLFGVNPKSMSDEELDEATRDYLLIRVERRHPLTGQNGPGSLNWVWPLATVFLLMAMLRRKRD